MDKVLYEIREKDLEIGLRGFPVGYCITSKIDPIKGLYYVNQPIIDLVDWECEKVIFLLLHGHEPLDSELSLLKKNLSKRAFLHPKIIEGLEKFPKEMAPMSVFVIALELLNLYEGKNDYLEDTLNLIAKIPLIGAAVITHQTSDHKIKDSYTEGYMKNFSQLIHGKKNAHLDEIFRLFNLLHYDHGGGNLSTFVGKAIASGLEDTYGSLVGAVHALNGLRHGSANKKALIDLQKLSTALSEINKDTVNHWIRNEVHQHHLIYGFGHAVLRAEDSRATILYDYATQHYSERRLIQISLLLRNLVPEALKKISKIDDPYPNVDAISGVLLYEGGFTQIKHYVILFAMARVVGISIQILYERTQARDGKGLPIVRPKYLFKLRS